MESDHYLKLVGEAAKILRKEKAVAFSTKLDTKSPNPFIRHMYTADPSAHVWEDGRLYVYASHDIAPPRGCDLMDRYHVFSTDDMINWTDHGEILSSDQVPWGRKEGGFMWAPDCAYRNGTYYFYFPHPSETDWNDSWKIGVATSDKPAEGFKVQGYIEGMDPMIDPCVFVDDDGQAYIYNGGGGTCKGGKLKDNMIELDGPMRTMEGLSDFHEATGYISITENITCLILIITTTEKNITECVMPSVIHLWGLGNTREFTWNPPIVIPTTALLSSSRDNGILSITTVHCPVMIGCALSVWTNCTTIRTAL